MRLIGISFYVDGSEIRARPLNANDPSAVDRSTILLRPHLGTLRATGSYRADVWFRLRSGTVRGAEVSGRPMLKISPPGEALVGFGAVLGKCLMQIPVIPIERLHLYIAEAIIRNRFRDEGEGAFAEWLLRQIELRAARDVQAVLGLV